MSNKSRNHRVSLPFQLLKTFTEKELTNFKKLLSSGYLSANESLGKLLDILKKLALQHFSFSPDLQIKVYQALCVEENIGKKLSVSQNKKLNRLMNEMLSVAEKFLMFDDVKNKDEYEAKILYPKLINRNQLLLYSKRIKATEKKLNSIEKRDAEFHNQFYYIQKEKAELLFKSNALGKEDNYAELLYHTDVKYLLVKLQYHLAQITLQKKYPKKTFDFEPYKACEALFNLPQYQQNPLIQICLLNIALVEKADDDTYNLLFNALQEYLNVIPASFLAPSYVNLNNYCSVQIAKGKFDFYQKLKTVFEVMHNNDLLANNSKIDISILKNIITVACRLREFDWANKMLDENIDYVNKDVRESIYHYNKGIIEFNMGNYSASLDHFVKVRKVDEFYSVNLKVNLLQCFYEKDKNYEDQTQQMIDSFRIFLTATKKLTASDITSYKNFILYFNKLYGFRKIIDKQKRSIKINSTLPVLIDSIKNQEFVSYKKWLLAKSDTLQKDYANNINT